MKEPAKVPMTASPPRRTDFVPGGRMIVVIESKRCSTQT
jgi:hypothetical protein